MASPNDAPFSGPANLDALTADRARMWRSFTSATTGAATLVVVVLLGMAVFLL